MKQASTDGLQVHYNQEWEYQALSGNAKEAFWGEHRFLELEIKSIVTVANEPDRDFCF